MGGPLTRHITTIHSPTELDALVFAHVAVVLATPLPLAPLRARLEASFPTLVAHHARVAALLDDEPPALAGSH